MSSARSTRKRRGAAATPAEQGKGPNEQLDVAKQEDQEGAKELSVGEKKPEEEVPCEPQSDVTNEAEAKPSSPKKAKIGDEQPHEDTAEKVEDATEDATEQAKDGEKIEDATELAKDTEKGEDADKVEDVTEKPESTTTERAKDDAGRQETVTGGKIHDVHEEVQQQKPEIATAEQ